jgi:hypothetical protein
MIILESLPDIMTRSGMKPVQTFENGEMIVTVKKQEPAFVGADQAENSYGDLDYIWQIHRRRRVQLIKEVQRSTGEKPESVHDRKALKASKERIPGDRILR